MYKVFFVFWQNNQLIIAAVFDFYSIKEGAGDERNAICLRNFFYLFYSNGWIVYQSTFLFLGYNYQWCILYLKKDVK